MNLIEENRTKMAEQPTSPTKTRTRPEDIQAHYDVSDDFFGLFQDPSRIYSCAYFERDDMTLEEAQYAKIDLNLDKLDLKPGMTLLDIGCGWGTTMKRAVEKFDVNVIGLTLSKNQQARAEALLDSIDTDRSRRCGCRAGRTSTSPSTASCRSRPSSTSATRTTTTSSRGRFDIMPDDGRMTVQSSVSYHPYDLAARGKKLSFETARFIKFIVTEIFPGGRLPSTQMMVDHGEKAGFVVPEPLSLRPHYIKTLHIWGDTLESNRDKAIEVTSEEVYNRYIKYLRGCEHYFTDEMLDCQPGDLPQAGGVPPDSRAPVGLALRRSSNR